MNTTDAYKDLVGPLLLQFLKDLKADIEKDGLIPTLDEAIQRTEEHLKGL